MAGTWMDRSPPCSRQLEDVLLEATVDADLLERVGLGRLEAEDVQDADVRLRRRAAALRRRAAGKCQADLHIQPVGHQGARGNTSSRVLCKQKCTCNQCQCAVGEAFG